MKNVKAINVIDLKIANPVRIVEAVQSALAFVIEHGGPDAAARFYYEDVEVLVDRNTDVSATVALYTERRSLMNRPIYAAIKGAE